MPLRSYLMAIAIFANEVKGKSMLALSRDLGTQYKPRSSWRTKFANLWLPKFGKRRSAARARRPKLTAHFSAGMCGRRTGERIGGIAGSVKTKAASGASWLLSVSAAATLYPVYSAARSKR
jgi:hypothetical protein